jgi:hypothetical protein
LIQISSSAIPLYIPTDIFSNDILDVKLFIPENTQIIIVSSLEKPFYYSFLLASFLFQKAKLQDGISVDE